MKEHDQRPPLTMDVICEMAQKALLQAGVHHPLLIIETSQQALVLQIDQLQDTHETRKLQLYLAGFQTAQQVNMGALKQAFFINEAWMSKAEKDQPLDMPPSQDPNRIEVLCISGFYTITREMKLRMYILLRDKRGKLTGVEESISPDDVQVRSPLLEAFVEGYQSGHARKS